MSGPRPKSIVFFAVGSRGDVQPLLALWTHLLSQGTIDFADVLLTRDYAHLATAAGDTRVRVHEDARNSRAAFRAASASVAADNAANAGACDAVSLTRRTIGAILQNGVYACADSVHDVARRTGAAAVVATTLGALAAKSASMRLGIPAVVIHFQPNLRTPSFPFYLASRDAAIAAGAAIAAAAAHGDGAYVESEENAKSFDKFFEMVPEPVAALNAMNAAQENVAPARWDDVARLFDGDDPAVRVVTAYPTALVPPPRQLGATGVGVAAIEPLADDFTQPGWDARTRCPSLHAFLSQCAAANSKPVCMSLGSVYVGPDDLRRISATFLRGLRAADAARAVLLGGSEQNALSRTLLTDAEDEDGSLREWAAAHVFEPAAGEAGPEFAWLLPQCCCMITYGGAGTVAAALAAGTPVVVAPVGADQYFWGEIVHRSGYGARIEAGIASCSAEAVAAAVRRVGEKDVVVTVRAYAEERGRRIGGCEALRRMLDELLMRKA